jgi:hypothetical protein
MKKLFFIAFAMLFSANLLLAQNAKPESKANGATRPKGQAVKMTAKKNDQAIAKEETNNQASKDAPHKDATINSNNNPNNQSQPVMKKDGTPDKRYKANQNLKKDGTPDKRFKENKAGSSKK